MAAENTTRPRSRSWANASVQAGLSGAKFAPVMATRRPPSARRARAERTWRRMVSAMRRSTWAIAENGGFISTTLGRTPAPRWSSICAASNRVTGMLGKRRASRPARVSASSLSMSAPPASSARMASRPVPAEGSSTRSAGVIAAAVLAATPSVIGVENCWSAWLSAERRVCVGRSPPILVSIGSMAVGDAPLARIAGPNLRRNRTVAASQES